MAKCIIESIGFSATTSISKALEFGGLNYVTHGARNFNAPVAIGLADLPIAEFLRQMNTCSTDYANAIAVHCIYNLEELQQETKDTDIALLGLCRRDQKRQILSCFYWAINNLMTGREDALRLLVQKYQSFDGLFKQCKLKSNLITHFLLYSAERVVDYNLQLINKTNSIILMEDFIESPYEHATKLGLTGIEGKNISVPESNSHNKKASKYEFLAGAEKDLDAILGILRFSYNGQNVSIAEVENLLHQNSLMSQAT